MAGARGLLINITGGEDMTLFEVDQAANRIREEVDEEANIIFGSAIDETLNGKVRVSVVATGIESAEQRMKERPRLVAVGGLPMQQAPVSQVSGSGQHAPLQQASVPQASTAVSGQAAQAPAQSFVPSQPQPAPARNPASPNVIPPRVGQRPVMQPAQSAPRNYGDTQYSDQGAYDAPRQADSFETEREEDHLATYGRPALPPQIAAARAEQAPRATRAPALRGLFAETAKPASDAIPVPRKSLFGIVTGAIRGHALSASATPPVRAEQQEPRQEPARANVRQAGGDEMGIDIPAFLRRQSS